LIYIKEKCQDILDQAKKLSLDEQASLVLLPEQSGSTNRPNQIETNPKRTQDADYAEEDEDDSDEEFVQVNDETSGPPVIQEDSNAVIEDKEEEDSVTMEIKHTDPEKIGK
jgi:hypothetical protein